MMTTHKWMATTTTTAAAATICEFNASLSVLAHLPGCVSINRVCVRAFVMRTQNASVMNDHVWGIIIVLGGRFPSDNHMYLHVL